MYSSIWKFLTTLFKVKVMLDKVPPVSKFDGFIRGLYKMAATFVGGTAVPVAKYVLQLHEWLVKKGADPQQPDGPVT